MKIRRIGVALLTAVGGFFAPAQMMADLLLSENFEYEVGSAVCGQGDWKRVGTKTESPILVVSPALTYPGYANSPVGNAVKLTSSGGIQDQCVMKSFASNTNKILDGSIYASALVKVESVKDEVYFLVMGAGISAGLVDGKSPGEIARVFCSPGDAEGKFKFGVSKNAAAASAKTDDLNLGETYLVVMKYEYVAGTINDKFSVWVNPASEASAALEADATKADASATYGMQCIELRQGTNSSKKAPDVIVDALRVATTWDELFPVASDEPVVTPPTMTVTPEVVATPAIFGKVGESTVVARFKVNTANQTAPVQVYLTGANADQYAIDVESIPVDATETVVTLSYKPTVIGKHIGRVSFESALAELNTGYNFSMMSIDPANPPVLSVAPTSVAPFTATVGTPVEKSIEVTTGNIPDFGTARILNASGAFRINSGSLLKSGATTIKITFDPKVQGSYSDILELSAPGAETVTIKLEGSATGGVAAEEKQGDELPLDDSKPLVSLNETFDGVETNKPFTLAGWKNVAMKGTRAWWGYTEANGNKAAKVTPYDSKVEIGASVPCEMLLATPALDYKRTPARFLTFRVMGQMMVDGQSDLLEVCYMDMVEGKLYSSPINGLALPASSDLNNKWQEYVVDLEGLDLADSFFIGFRYNSNRGRENTATYYVDDVTWGRADIPFIRPAVKNHAFQVKVNDNHEMNFSVKGLNLTNPIALKMVGSHAAKFSLSHTQLPAEGGEFKVTFNSADLGEHFGFVEMKSGDAPTSYIDLYGVTSMVDGVDDLNAARMVITVGDGKISVDGADVDSIEVYALNGVKLAAATGNKADISNLSSGNYIVKVSTPAGVKVCKVAVK